MFAIGHLSNHMKSLYLLLALISLCVTVVPAQNSITRLLYTKKQLNYDIVKFDDLNKEESFYSNHIIEGISQSIPKILKYTSYQFEYFEEVSLYDKGNDNYELELKFTNKDILGDVYYKEIYLGDVLYPKLSGYDLQLFYHGEVVKDFRIPVHTIPFDTAFLFNFKRKEKIDKSLFSTEVAAKKLEFDKNSQEKFDTIVKLIGAYYSLNSTLDMIKDKLNAIDFTVVDMIPVYKFQLDDIEKQLDDLRSIDYIKKLHLDKSDPIQFIQRLDEISVKTKQLKTVAEQYLKSMDFWYFRTGMENLAKKDTIQAIKFFKRSIEMNPLFPQSQYQLARIDLIRGNLLEATSRVQMMIDTMDGGDDYIRLFYELDNILFQKIIESGVILMDSSLYQEALTVFLKADSLCRVKKHIPCPSELYNLIANAKLGVYRSYLLIASRAVDSERLDLAMTYIDIALEYQKKSPADIPSDREAYDLLQGIVNTYMGKGYHALNNNNYNDAWNYFNNSLVLCNKYPKLNCSDDISKGLQRAQELMERRN